MGWFWRHRRDLGPWISELGCGLLVVLFVTLPLWVMTAAWRNPFKSLGLLLAALVAVFAVAFLNHWVSKKRG